MMQIYLYNYKYYLLLLYQKIYNNRLINNYEYQNIINHFMHIRKINQYFN